MAKELIRQYVFTPGAAGVGTIKIAGVYYLNQILMITNNTRGTILYSIANTTFAGTTATFTAADDATSFPTVTQAEAGYTTITLAIDTSSHSSTDLLQIFTDTAEQGLTIRPWNFGTDAIERMRTSHPQSLIDADFEYGLQPTKWAGYGTMRFYPSAYELPGVDLEVSTITTDYFNTSTSNSLITVTYTTTHGLAVGNVVNISGLNKGINGYSRAAGNFLVFSVPSSTQITYFARGVVGTAAGQSLYTDETLSKRGALYTNASIPVASAASDGATPSVITLTFTNPHGLIPGSAIHAIMASGTNATLASGPFIVTSVPTLTTLTYLARAGGAVSSPASVTLYAFSNSTIIHRPYDGGVILETRSPVHGAQVVRQSKKYFRYQSGKGFLWSSGTLMRPNYDIQSVSAGGTAIGSIITVTTDDIDHGLQIGAEVRLEGIITSGYNGNYTVASIVGDYTFTVLATNVLGNTTAQLDVEAKVFVTGWKGCHVRAGIFDDQNGVFWEYDGSQLCAVKRSSTFQISGTMAATLNSNSITGTNTRFTQQLRAGSKIVIRGMTHTITRIANDTSMFITPDYRGATATGIKAGLIREVRVPQSQFNGDPIDGTGYSRFNVNLSKMQMLGIQYSWYGAGFIDFMVRGADGNWVFAHRMKNNNINNEAYMRSGNLPVRYSIENDGPFSHLTAAMTDSQNTVPIADLRYFPTTGVVYIDNEIISYSGKSAAAGPGNLTGCSRAAQYTLYQAGNSNNALMAGSAAIHDINAGVIYIGNTCSPTLSHWGSSMIMDGKFDEDRGYIFNYQRTSMSLTTTTQTAFLIRLAPSVENSQVGALGTKDLLNRSQMLLQAIAIAISTGTSPGAVVVEGVLNPKNFASATWTALNPESAGGQPSFAQVSTSFTWTSGTFAIPGEQVFAFTAPTTTSGTVNDRLPLTQLKELTGAALGGDFIYPDGSDILAINVRLTAGSASGHVLLSWSEAQA